MEKLVDKLNELEIHVKNRCVDKVILNGVEMNYIQSVTVQYTAQSLTEVTLVMSAYDSDIKVVVDDDKHSGI